MTNNSIALAVLPVILLVATIGCGSRQTVGGGTTSGPQAARESLAGTWQYENNTAVTTEKIILTLRSDGTYTKTLEATSGGLPLGGTHSGTWSAVGSVISLSGNSQWPAYTHDLSMFRRVG